MTGARIREVIQDAVRDVIRARRSAGPKPEAADRGTISMFTAIFALFVIMLAGLLVDGGLAIHARERAADIAEQGARAAANDIDIDELRRTGEPRISDGGTACQKTAELLAAYPEVQPSWSCAVSDDRQTASVMITIKVQPQLLSIVPGIGAFTMTSKATAHPERGGDEG